MTDLRSEIELLEANVRAACTALRQARETVNLLREERDGLAEALWTISTGSDLVSATVARAALLKMPLCMECDQRRAVEGEDLCEECAQNQAEAAHERDQGECFRGAEAEAFHAEQMARIQRMDK